MIATMNAPTLQLPTFGEIKEWLKDFFVSHFGTEEGTCDVETGIQYGFDSIDQEEDEEEEEEEN